MLWYPTKCSMLKLMVQVKGGLHRCIHHLSIITLAPCFLCLLVRVYEEIRLVKNDTTFLLCLCQVHLNRLHQEWKQIFPSSHRDFFHEFVKMLAHGIVRFTSATKLGFIPLEFWRRACRVWLFLALEFLHLCIVVLERV